MQGRSLTITPDRWRRLQELFEQALPLSAEERASTLLAACPDDAPLREQVMSLLLVSADDAHTIEGRVDRAIAGTARMIDLSPGEMVGRYRVVSLLGRGGMGAVYLAERADEQYQQRVALKVVERGLLHSEIAGRFRAERQILARLVHPNIARLLDGGQMSDGAPYLVMEHVEGVRIDHYCAGQALSTAARLRLMQQVCSAVQYAHQNLVIHRDLKPSNILVSAEGVPKLLDFGIAKLIDNGSSPTAPVTVLRDRMLTPEHASPEQIRGEPVGTVSDVYSLGVLLYELLTGLRPYELSGLTLTQVERVISSTPSPPSQRVTGTTARELAGDLDNIVMKAMHHDVQQRYSSAAAMAQDIQSYLDGRTVQARPDTWTYRASKFFRRHAVPTVGIAVSLLAIMVVIAIYTARLAAERDAAERERQTAISVSDFMIDVFRRANPQEGRGDKATLRDALNAAATRIERDLVDQPRLRVTLMRNMGQSYSGLALWPEARDLLERAVSQARAELGVQDVEVARTLEALGHVLFNMSKYEEAERVFNESSAIRTSLGSEGDIESIRLLHSIGATLRAQQRMEEAITYHRRAEEYARALDPPNPAVLGHVLEGFATTYGMAGDSRKAERYAREALPLVRDVVYEGHDIEANALNALATALRGLYLLDEAAAVGRQLVERQTRMLGPDHALVGRAHNNYANILRTRGDYANAEMELREALRIHELNRPVTDTNISIAHHNLGALLREAGDTERALAELEVALEMKRATVGARGPQVVSTLLEKAALLRDRGEIAAAEPLLAEAESIGAEKFDGTDRRRSLLLLERGKMQLAGGYIGAAEKTLDESMRQFREQDEPVRLAESLAALADVMTRTDRAPQARALLDEELQIRRKVYPRTHWGIADAESRLGAVLALTGDAARGRALLTQSVEKLRAQRPQGDAVTAAAERRVREAGG